MANKILDNNEEYDFVKIEGITDISNSVKDVENGVKSDVKNRIQELSTSIISHKIKYQKAHIILFHGAKTEAEKTLTAIFLAKIQNSPIYRIDLSLMVSKYIGETEKNLDNFLNHAESSDVILFIPEADYFFSKLKNTKKASENSNKIDKIIQKLNAYQRLIVLGGEAEIDTSEFFPGRIEIKVKFKKTSPKPEILLKDMVIYFSISMAILIICVLIGSAIGSSYGGWNGLVGIGIGFVVGLIIGFFIFILLMTKKLKRKTQ